MTLIRVRDLTHAYTTHFWSPKAYGARSISLAVERGEIHGFLGPNGAGKSTTIKALLGLIRPQAGTLELFGRPVSDGGWRSRVGYMPEHPTFYDYLTGLEMVTWFGRLAGLTRHEAELEATRQLERVGLGQAMRRRIRGYSKGMLQRAGLAQALLGSPELLILDEPMTGLDPIGRKEMRELIHALRAEGKTVFYSTHILPDIEMTCDRVTIVDKGRTMRTGRLDDILTETTRGVTVAVDGLGPEAVDRVLEAHPSAVADADRITLEVDRPDEAERIARELMTQLGGRLLRFEPHRDDLETIFVHSLEAHAAEEAGR